MFCTVSDLEKLLLAEIPTDKLQTAELAIEWATEAIRNYTNQTISAVANDPVTLDGNGHTKLFLPELPVTDLYSVELEGDVLVEGYDYKLGKHGVLVRLNGVWTYGVQNVDVVYDHGYAVIPDDIVSVCARSAIRLYQATLRAYESGGVSGVSSLGLGDYQVSYSQDQGSEGLLGISGARSLLLSEKDLLDRYRIKNL